MHYFVAIATHRSSKFVNHLTQEDLPFSVFDAFTRCSKGYKGAWNNLGSIKTSVYDLSKGTRTGHRILSRRYLLYGKLKKVYSKVYNGETRKEKGFWISNNYISDPTKVISKYRKQQLQMIDLDVGNVISCNRAHVVDAT